MSRHASSRHSRPEPKLEHAPARQPGRRGPTRPRGPWIHGKVATLGLIGGIGGGKSEAAKAFANSGPDVLVLDADHIGHVLLDQRPSLEAVTARFGRSVLMHSDPEDPSSPIIVNRMVLGSIVFSNPQALKDLEAILHPRMRQTFERAIQRAVRKGTVRLIVLDAPILYEAGWESLCDRVVFIDTPRELRLERLRQSRGWTEPELSRREQAQWPIETKRDRANVVIDNSGDPAALQQAVLTLRQSLFPTRPDTTRRDSK